MPQKTRVTLQSVNENVLEVLRRVERTDSRIAAMQVLVSRIPNIESRLDDIEARLSRLEFRMANLEGLYEHHDKKLEILDHEYISIRAALKRLEESFDKLEVDALRDRVRVLEEKVGTLEKSSLN
jgi:predicted nuclease with TOPRIM domain